MNGQLPNSTETDLAPNREARLNGRQRLDLLYSGSWRIVAGLPTTAVGAIAIWSLPGDPAGNVVGTALGFLFLALGTYMSWRGVSFLVDAVTRHVAMVTARVGRDINYSFRSGNFYYLVVGPTKTWIAPKVFDALPVGLLCHAYLSPCSVHLLSIEPAAAEDLALSLRFGGAGAYAWARFSWGRFFAALATFELATAIHFVIIGHPVSGVPIAVLSIATFALLLWVRIHPRAESTDYGDWNDSDVTDDLDEEDDANIVDEGGPPT